MVANQSPSHHPLPPIGVNPPPSSTQTLPRPPAHTDLPVALPGIAPDLEAQRILPPAPPQQPVVRMHQQAPPPPPTAPPRATHSPPPRPSPPSQEVSELRRQLDDLRQLVRDVVQQNGDILDRMRPPACSAQSSAQSALSQASGYDAHPPSAPPAPPQSPAHPPAEPPTQPDPSRFDRADLKRLSTNLEPGRVTRWIINFVDTIEDYSKQAAALLRKPHDDARAATTNNPHLQSLDRWAARQALNCMDHTQPYVRLLFNSSSADTDEARRSGVALLHLIRQRSQVVSGEAARLLVSQFDAKVYFTSAMDAPTFHLQADELRSDFEALPDERTAVPHALLRSLLAKLPASIKTYTSQLEVKLLEAQLMKAPAPWTYDQLVLLASQFTLLAARQNAPAPSVNAAERKPKKDKPPAGSEHRPCPCCGKTGHNARDCPTSCSECRNRSCPGNYGAPCVVRSSTKPTVVHNALGKPVPPNVLRILIKARSSKEVAAATIPASTNTCTSNFAGNYWHGTEQVAESNMLHADIPKASR